ncbi:MAG: glycogen phosphorylase, partial [Gaiellaceae bacterium]|nr:glycogen phosphorylase [Gaiellaceae bacterium]
MTPPSGHSVNTSALPEELEPLARLAYNLAWTWDETIAGVLGEVDPAGLATAGGNPVAMLAHAAPERLAELAADDGFRQRLAQADARLDEHLKGPSWYGTLNSPPRSIAYFSPEFGLTEVLPQYSGGLGVLAG